MTPPVERWRGSLVLAFFTIFYLAFFANSLASGNYIAPSDSLDFGLSAYLSDQTIWTDGMYSGYPIAADPQAMIWYPVFRLFRAAGLGWNLFMIAAYVIASFGAFLLVWRLTACRVAALFGGLVYGFSGMLLGHISHYNQVHVAAWVPFLLFGMVELWSGRVAVGGLIGSAALALMVLAGHPQLMVYAVYLTAAYTGYRVIRTQAELRQRVHLIAASAAAVAVGFGLAAILLVPAQELSALGRRAETSWELFVSRSLPPWQVLTLVLPLGFGGFRTTADTQVAYFGESSPGEMTGYLGLLPLCLAVGGVWWCRRHRAETLFWLGAGLVALGLALGDATPLASGAFHLPLYGAFRVPARHLFLVTLCAAVAASLVLAEVITDRRWALMRRAVIGTSAVAALAALTFVWRHDDVRWLLADDRTYRIWAFGLPALLAAGLIVAATVAARRPAWTGAAAALVVTVHVAEMAVFHFVYPGYAQEYAGVPTEWVTLHPRMEELRTSLGQTGGRVLAADGSRNWFLRPNLTRAWAVPAASGTVPWGSSGTPICCVWADRATSRPRSSAATTGRQIS